MLFLNAIVNEEGKIEFEYQYFIVIRMTLGDNAMGCSHSNNIEQIESRYKNAFPDICNRVVCILSNSKISTIPTQFININEN